MGAFSHSQQARLDFRISPEHKSLIERAAMAQGQTITSFAVSALVRVATETIQKDTERAFSEKDAQVFLDMISAPSEPNAALKAAAEKYKQRDER